MKLNRFKRGGMLGRACVAFAVIAALATTTAAAFGATVAQIGGTEYDTLAAAVKAAQPVAQVTVGGVVSKYADLHEALEAAKAAGSVCELLGDVTLTGNWTPVADFNGTFDGKGFTITGLAVAGTADLGLFANTSTSATIKDLTISGATITSTSGSNHGVLAGSVSGSNISNVKVLGSTVSAAGGQYTGGLIGTGYPASCQCEVASCTVTGYDQVGGLIGYLWVGHIENCVVTNNAVTATSERAGGLVGKMQIAAGNLGASTMWVNNNVVSGTATAPDMAGGLCGQIMGDVNVYSIANNAVDVTLSAPVTNPIGNLRDGQNAAFTGVLAANITGNTWTDVTLAAGSFQYTNVASGVDPQTIWNGEAPRTVEVTPATVQAALDAAKKGDTIVLTSGDYGELYLRNNGSDANRIMQDVTICVQDGAAVTVDQIAYQKVTGKSLDIENLTIDGITFDAPEKTAVLFDCDGAGSIRVNGLTIQNCVKVGNNSQGTTYDNAAFIGGYYDGATALNKTFAGDASLTCGYHDIRILNNQITNVLQPIKFPNDGPLYGLTVTGNTFTGCTDNHFMLSTKTTGAVLIANNTIVDMTGRFARISGALATAAFTITNNTVTTPRMYDTGGDGDIFKITGTAGFTVTQADNQWLDGAYQGDAKWIAMGDATKLPVCQIGETKYPTIADAYKAAKSGDTVKILVDTIDSIVGIPAGVTVEGVEAKTTVTSGMGSPLLNGVTLKNIKFAYPADVFEWPSIKNTFALYNCEFDQKGDYGLKIDGPNGGTIYAEGCIFRSTTAISQGNPATFKNCQFLLNSYSGDFDLSLFTDTTLDGCQFVKDYTASDRGIYVKTDNIVIDLKNCSIIDSDKPLTDLFCRDEGYNKGIGVVDGVRNQDGKFIAGTFMTVHCEIPCAEGYVPMLVPGATDVYTLGTLIKKDDETKTVPALEQASDSIVNEQKVEQNVKDETAKVQIKTQTVVEGVKLTTAPEKVGETIVAPAGMQAVVDAAKAKNKDLNDALESSSATMVTVKVDVVVSPIVYTNTEAASEQSVAAFKLEPKATVTVVNQTSGEETVTKSETVKVTNEMIDKTVDIDVTVYTGFRPEMVVHKDENGKVIETFTGDQIAYDETRKTITVKIHHFSTIEAVKVSYAAQAGDGLYATLAEAFAAVPDATPTTVKLLKDLTLDGAVTFAAGKTATFDFAGRTLTGGLIESAGALTLTGGTTDASLSCTGDGTMAITAGTYATALPAASDPAETNAGPFLVSGGSFVSAIPWAYCAPGYEPNAATAAPFGVKDANIYIRNIAAAQRYPWNGYVDITLDVSWSTKETARLFVLAYDGDDNRMDMTDAVAIMDGAETDVDCSKGFSVTAPSKKTLHIMWNSTEAVSEGSVKEGVHFKFIAK